MKTGGVADSYWTRIIGSGRSPFHFDVGELWSYRDLTLLFVRRDFIAQYKQTILGPLWFFLQPLFTTFVFTIVFGRIAKIPTDGIPDFLFYLSGVVCWSYFSVCLTETSDTFFKNAGIFGKVYFPRLCVPLGIVISNVFKFAIQFALFVAVLAYTRWHGASVVPSLYGVVLLPVLVIQMALVALGCGILVSALTTKYRDLSLVVQFGVQLWMYATPVVYPLSQIPERYRLLFSVNPMTNVIEGFRWAFLGTPSPEIGQVAVSLLVTAGVLLTGLALFNRVEKTFMDTI